MDRIDVSTTLTVSSRNSDRNAEKSIMTWLPLQSHNEQYPPPSNQNARQLESCIVVNTIILGKLHCAKTLSTLNLVQ